MKTKKNTNKSSNVSTVKESAMTTKKTNPSKSVAVSATTDSSPVVTPSTKTPATAASLVLGTMSATDLAKLVDDVTKTLDEAEAQLGPESPSLTGSDKRRAAKARKGADKILGMLAPIVQQHQLESPTLSTTQMMARQKVATTLQPLQLRLQKLQKRVADEAFNAQGDAWSMGLQFYSLLRSRAKNDGTVATSLEPVKAMFSYRHPDVKATKPKKVQTRAKAKLKGAIELASKHGVAQGVLAEEASLLGQTATGGATTTTTPASAPAVAPPAPASAGATQSVPPPAAAAAPGVITTAPVAHS